LLEGEGGSALVVRVGGVEIGGERGEGVLVFPAASRPSIRSRISREPKILPMILDTWPPMAAGCGLREGGAGCVWDWRGWLAD